MKNPFSFLTGKKSFTNVATLLRQNDIMESQSKISSRSALNYNQISLYINKGFAKRAEKMSELEFILKDLKGEVVLNNEQLRLIEKPNKEMTGSQFWNLATMYHDITGMAIIRKIGNGRVWSESKKVESLQILNSAYVEIQEDTTTGKIKHFKYSNPVTKEVENIPYEECIYWYIPDPMNANLPMPLLLSGLLSIQSNLEAEKQYNATLKNGGSIDGLFRFKESVSVEKVEQLKTDYARLLRDNKGANVPLVLGGDASFERIALSPQELQTIDNKKILLDDLLAITGVPKSLLGITTGETFSNADTSYKIFLRETIKPLANSLVDILNYGLIDERYDLDFIDPTPENVEEKLKVLEVGNTVNALTLNEKREMLGLESKKGGDEIEERVTTYEEKKNLKTVKEFVHPLRSEEYRDKYYADFLKGVSKNKIKFRKELNKYFIGQKQRVLESIRSLKSIKKADDFAFDVLNESLEIAYMNPLLVTMREIVEDEGGKTANLFNHNFAFNSSVDTSVNARFAFFAKEINKTTAKVLKDEFADWFKNKETIAELSSRISDAYDFEKTEKWRADRIVNTEVSTITNLSRNEAYKQIGIGVKIWVHRAGIKGGIRESHAHMDGEEVKYSERFSNGMLYPHEQGASASEVINCMCTF